MSDNIIQTGTKTRIAVIGAFFLGSIDFDNGQFNQPPTTSLLVEARAIDGQAIPPQKLSFNVPTELAEELASKGMLNMSSVAFQTKLILKDGNWSWVVKKVLTNKSGDQVLKIRALPGTLQVSRGRELVEVKTEGVTTEQAQMAQHHVRVTGGILRQTLDKIAAAAKTILS